MIDSRQDQMKREINQIRARLADHANGNGIQVGYGVGCGAVIADIATLLAYIDQLRTNYETTKAEMAGLRSEHEAQDRAITAHKRDEAALAKAQEFRRKVWEAVCPDKDHDPGDELILQRCEVTREDALDVERLYKLRAVLTPEVILVANEALLRHRDKYGDVHRKACDEAIVAVITAKELLHD